MKRKIVVIEDHDDVYYSQDWVHHSVIQSWDFIKDLSNEFETEIELYDSDMPFSNFES